MHVFTKLFIQICRTILIFAGVEGKSAHLPGILGAIPVNDKPMPILMGGAFYKKCSILRE
jgi:hypothetical protein